MAVIHKIAAAAAIALPLCYIICSKRCGAFLQQSVVATLWMVFLGIPLLGEDMPIHTTTTMITSVLSFIIPLKLSQLILYPTSGAKEKQEDSDSNLSQRLSLRRFVSFSGSVLYYAVPVQKSKFPTPTWLLLLRLNAEEALVIVGKLLILPFLESEMRRLVLVNEQPHLSLTVSPRVYMQLEVLFTLQIVAMAWTTDVQRIVISIVSGGRFEMLPMHNYPFLSRSLRDLWARRYNLLITTLLKDTVYIPSQEYHGLSKGVANLLAFLTSGLLHSWVAHFTFGGGVARACLFFVAQALWIVAVEQRPWYRDSVPTLGKIVLTVCYFYATAWLYVGLFLEVMPDWLDKNPQTTPKVPMLSDWMNQILGINTSIVQSREY